MMAANANNGKKAEKVEKRGRKPLAGEAANRQKQFRFTEKQYDLVNKITNGRPKRYLLEKVLLDAEKRRDLRDLTDGVRKELANEAYVTSPKCPCCAGLGMLIDTCGALRLQCANGHQWEIPYPNPKADNGDN